jgi:hypothetical protein
MTKGIIPAVLVEFNDLMSCLRLSNPKRVILRMAGARMF